MKYFVIGSIGKSGIPVCFKICTLLVFKKKCSVLSTGLLNFEIIQSSNGNFDSTRLFNHKKKSPLMKLHGQSLQILVFLLTS